MKKLIILAILLLFPAFLFAANTVTDSGSVVSVDMDENNSCDFTYSESCTLYGSFGTGAIIEAIIYVPSAASCQCVIKEGSDSGAEILNVTAADATDTRIMYPRRRLRPVLDFSAGSLGGDDHIIFLIKQ